MTVRPSVHMVVSDSASWNPCTHRSRSSPTYSPQTQLVCSLEVTSSIRCHPESRYHTGALQCALWRVWFRLLTPGDSQDGHTELPLSTRLRACLCLYKAAFRDAGMLTPGLSPEGRSTAVVHPTTSSQPLLTSGARCSAPPGPRLCTGISRHHKPLSPAGLLAMCHITRTCPVRLSHLAVGHSLIC
jgi:hypothetical protein